MATNDTRKQLLGLLDQFEAAVVAAASGELHRETRAAGIATHVANLRTQVDQLTDPNPPAPQPLPDGGKDDRIAQLEAQLAAARA